MITDLGQHHSVYSNIQIVIMANRPAFTRETFGDSTLFGLIQIANKPILGHLLEQFDRLGLTNISVVCLMKDENAYAEFILQYTSHPVRLIPVEGVLTTCDIIRNKIITKDQLMKGSFDHIFLFPIDLLTSTDLTSIVDFHISMNALVTIVASRQSIDEKEKSNAPGFQPASMTESCGRRLFVYDELDKSKLILLLNDDDALNEDLDLSLKQVSMNNDNEISHDASFDSLSGSMNEENSGLSIPPEFLEGFHSLVVDSSMHITNAYILSPECIRKLLEETTIHSIESELIPILCREKVERSRLVNEGDSQYSTAVPASIYCVKDKDFAFRVTDYATLYVANMKCSGSKLCGFSPSAEYTQIQGQNHGYFSEGKHQVHSSFKYSPFSVYGDNFNATAEDIKIIRSVIGRHCKIGKGASLFNTVLFDHVTIEEGVVLKECLVGSDTVIKAGSKLTKCIVVPGISTNKGLIKSNCFIQSGSKK